MGHGLSQNPLAGFRVDGAAVRMVGRDLRRPECVLAERDGTLWTSDARGGIMRIDPDGTQTLIRQRVAGEDPQAPPPRTPNGLAFDAAGNLLIANFATDAIEVTGRDGATETLLSSIDGVALGKTNFVLRDRRGRIWFTVTTRLDPWIRSLNEKTPDGYVAVIDEKGPRIVAEGFVGTNEIRFDAAEERLYVVETHARRISRLALQPDGSLAGREIFGPADLGGMPDGIAFDSFGNLWATLVCTDRLIALTPEGEILTLLDDGDPAATERLDRHYREGTITPDIMLPARGTLAPWMSSVTFGGPDLRRVYLGSLLGTSLPSFEAPVAGLPMVHWRS
jgi:sugar lactone lactonase YvrE